MLSPSAQYWRGWATVGAIAWVVSTCTALGLIMFAKWYWVR
jgi:hypothetical protein